MATKSISIPWKESPVSGGAVRLALSPHGKKVLDSTLRPRMPFCVAFACAYLWFPLVLQLPPSDQTLARVGQLASLNHPEVCMGPLGDFSDSSDGLAESEPCLVPEVSCDWLQLSCKPQQIIGILVLVLFLGNKTIWL